MRITLKQLKSLDACSEGITWVKSKKNKEIKHILRQCINEGHFDWANWYVTKLFSHPQLVRYAIFSAELCIQNYEKVHPDDNRPRNVIEATKEWFKNSTEENRIAVESARSAARSAAESAAWSARSAAWSAADSAAWSAARSAESARSAVESAWSAVESARSAADSARSAARSAAESAWSAADSAAWSARSAAWSAVDSAAWSAARSAAWSAAWSALIENAIEILGL